MSHDKSLDIQELDGISNMGILLGYLYTLFDR